MKMEWTKEYYGVQHLGNYNLQQTWVSVINYGSFSLLLEWFSGCKFSPKETRYNTINEAKLAGEKIMQEVK